jgi:hypothetical protein
MGLILPRVAGRHDLLGVLAASGELLVNCGAALPAALLF